MPRRVDFLHNREDFQTAVLAAMGFSNACIVAHTGLTDGQIAYRCRKVGIRRAAYRDGESRLSLAILQRSKSFIEAQVEHTVRAALPRPKGRRATA